MHRAPELLRTPLVSSLRHPGSHLQLVRVPGDRSAEAFLTLPSQPGESPAELFQRFYRWVEANPEFRILRQDVFGIVADNSHPPGAIYRLNGAEWPFTWVEQGNGAGCPVAGIQVHALAGREVQPLRVGGRTLGAAFEDDHARYCVLAGLQPRDPHASRATQTRELLALMQEALANAGLGFGDVFRTWFYLDDILDWYGEFNAARNEFFRHQGVFDRLVPASTGVGGRNAARTAVVADLMALRPKTDAVRCIAVPSPLQCPALEYGSSFSRAVEVSMPHQRRLYVSGTASILPDGRTAHVDDVEAQVALTMDVVGAILESRGLTWTDTVRGIGYFKNMADAPVFARWCAARDLSAWPVIVTKNDICRDDLLFELELDAVAPC
ncbi:MAG: translation initiation inhibitor [Verrucomicrobiales bacterium]|nr:translation initiation inhibitor [Verrucomicrobiales bacterium]